MQLVVLFLAASVALVSAQYRERYQEPQSYPDRYPAQQQYEPYYRRDPRNQQRDPRIRQVVPYTREDTPQQGRPADREQQPRSLKTERESFIKPVQFPDRRQQQTYERTPQRPEVQQTQAYLSTFGFFGAPQHELPYPPVDTAFYPTFQGRPEITRFESEQNYQRPRYAAPPQRFESVLALDSTASATVDAEAPRFRYPDGRADPADTPLLRGEPLASPDFRASASQPRAPPGAPLRNPFGALPGAPIGALPRAPIGALPVAPIGALPRAPIGPYAQPQTRTPAPSEPEDETYNLPGQFDAGRAAAPGSVLCRGNWTHLTADSGFVSSYKVPGSDFYAPNDDCYWSVRVPGASGYQISFHSFDVDAGVPVFGLTGSCPGDYLAVFVTDRVAEGGQDSFKTRLRHKYCHVMQDDFSGSVPSTSVEGQALAFHFHTDKFVQRRGFVLSYEAVFPAVVTTTVSPLKCAGREMVYKASGVTGTIASPNFGNGDYLKDDTCVWRVWAEEGQAIQFQIEDLKLEGGYPICAYDSLNIFEGRFAYGEPIVKLCGEQEKTIFTTKGSSAILVFKSDNVNENRGFNLTFRVRNTGLDFHNQPETKQQPREITRHMLGTPIQTLSSARKCVPGNNIGLQADTQLRALESPGFQSQGSYFGNDTCIWTIKCGSPDQLVMMYFETFEIETGYGRRSFGTFDACQYDYLQFFDARKDNMMSMPKKFCGNTVPEELKMFSMNSDRVTILMVSDGQLQWKGFKVNYVCQPKEFAPSPVQLVRTTPRPYFSRCDGHVQNLAATVDSLATIESPNFGTRPYFADDTCEWRISGGPDTHILVEFVNFQLEDSHPRCLADNIVLYDGFESGSRMIGKYCGSRYPKQVQSTSGQVVIRFTADSFNQNRGFQLAYKAVLNDRP